ncbi:PucR family transcriptional regulator ligand-binding domain-containing protein [Clostridioides difficile]
MFQCKDLFTLPSLSNIKLICGNNGLNNIIRWSYKAESQDLSNWVKGGELLIISGAVIERKDFNLSSLITQAINLKLSGALLLVGENYIKSIPKSLIKICNDYNFPIFAINWSTPLVNIFEELGHAIVISSINKNNEDFVANIVFGKEYSEEMLLLKGANLNYNLKLPQKVFLIHFYDDVYLPLSKLSLNEFEINYLTNFIKSLFEANNMKVLISSYGNNIIGLFSPSKDSDVLNDLFNEFILKATKAMPHLSLIIGVGKTYCSSNIQTSFKEASKCTSIATKLKKHNDVIFYDRLGILSLFCDIDRNDILNEFSNQILGELIKYDKDNNSDLLKTLKIYLNNNCNIIKTADELSSHRNTIKYRLNRIMEITNEDLNDPFYRLNLQNAILIHTFIK